MRPMMKTAGLAALIAAVAVISPLYGGETKKWDDIPEAVRKTVLANGGKAGQTVDKENEKFNGKAVYEASVKDKDGTIADLVITEDGKLVTTKHDDASDRAKEIAAAAQKAPKAKTDSAYPTFTHPRDITNPYLPLAYLKQDILEGKEEGHAIRIERTVKPKLNKSFKIGGQKVNALVVEDREYEDGKIAEVAIDYFAQDDLGTVYYLGEDVDEYKDGKMAGHEGSWLFGVHTQKLGVILPAHPAVGDKFKSEDVSDTIHEEDEVLSTSETVTCPAGTYEKCVKVKETLADGKTEYKFYAPGVGVVREAPSDGDVLLKSHATRKSTL